MHIERIERFADFEALRAQWEAVYVADPDANFYLSWSWLSSWLERPERDGRNLGGWIVLAAKSSPEAREYLAFMPLRLAPAEGGARMTMAGRRIADYTGVICRPGMQEQAVPALAEAAKGLRWQQWQIEYLRNQPEIIRLLLSQFPSTAFTVGEVKLFNKGEDIDKSICPYVELPTSWDDYLSTRVSANMRQKLRRLLRAVEASPELTVTVATPATIERDIKILLQLWKNRWQERKGDKLQAMLQVTATNLYRNFPSGHVHLPIMWAGRRPVGALASYIDEHKKVMHFNIAGRDDTFQQPSPGLVLHAHNIKHAIATGLRTYDFLRGNETYKYSFGAHDRRLRSFVITRKAGTVR